jgi:alpha-galactosidase
MRADEPSDPDLSRRAFLRRGIVLGAGATAAVSLGAGPPAPSPGVSAGGPSLPARLPDSPSGVFVQHAGAELAAAARQGNRFTTPQAAVSVDGSMVRVACPGGPLSRVVLRWALRLPPEAVYLGDQWERSYGDLQWRGLQPERIMPWYFGAFTAADGRSFVAGVATQPSALCFWTIDSDGISLWLDFRNGGSPCLPGDREIAAASIVSFGSEAGESPMGALRRLCAALCPSPRRLKGPVCGNNNWYYAYGRNFDAAAMRRDAAFLAELAEGRETRPFCVIDAGWTAGSSCPGGPWTHGEPGRFPDMPGLAADMRKLGVRPGIWVRPTALTEVDDPRRLRSGPVRGAEKPLDLTLPENLSLIRADLARIRSWGYDLIKHDFSTYDVVGRWGFEMGAELTDAGWHFADRSLTNAEIILRLYRTLRAGGGDAVLLGCNTIGHLAAGLFEIQRTGDDTSGLVWERTRRMGVNTLAFRLPQHGSFFVNDADCAAHTEHTPWELDRQYLDLVSRSGTALFVSVDPRTVSPSQRATLKDAMQTALSGRGNATCEPLDWIHTTAPAQWRIGDRTVRYDWNQPFGAWPLKV